jgi:hypothetical protein
MPPKKTWHWRKFSEGADDGDKEDSTTPALSKRTIHGAVFPRLSRESTFIDLDESSADEGKVDDRSSPAKKIRRHGVDTTTAAEEANVDAIDTSDANEDGVEQVTSTEPASTPKDRFEVSSQLLEDFWTSGHVSGALLEAAEQLLAEGHVVLAVPNWNETEIKGELLDTLENLPELKAGVFKRDLSQQVSLHATGAMGYASCFHAPVVRKMRYLVWKIAVPVLAALARRGGGPSASGDVLAVTQIPDPLMVRAIGQTPKNDIWHWDEAQGADARQKIFGGWVSISGTQHFQAIRRSHSAAGRGGDGDAAKRAGFVKVHKAPPGEEQKISVPPGCILIFWENMYHNVLPAPGPMLRLWTGWQLGPRGLPSIKAQQEFEEVLAEQAPFPRKSGQHVGIANLQSYRAKAAEIHQWRRDHLVPDLHRERMTSDTNLPPSLEKLQKKYRPYTEQEKRVLEPVDVVPVRADPGALTQRGPSLHRRRGKRSRA